MIPATMMTADITLNYKTVTGVDAYNRPVVSESSVTVKGFYQGRRTNTVVDGGDILKTDAMVIVQPDVSVDDLESVTINNETFGIDGVPMPHWNPRSVSVQYIGIYLRKGAS